MVFSGWLGAATAVLVAALPPVPETVVRETKSYGTVTVPHAKHLSARVACRSCHGPGRVGKIEFTPKTAHATCRNCHVEIARGPVDCRGCHVVPPKEAPAVAEAPPGGATVAAAAGETRSFTVEAGSSQIDDSTRERREREAALLEAPEIRPRAVFGKVIEVGVSLMAGQEHLVSVGPTFQLTARSGPNVMQYGLTFVGGAGTGRTQLVIGLGRAWEMVPHLALSALALGGLDATHAPISVMPALGLRTGLELSGRSPWTLGFSATGLVDLMRGEAQGEKTSGFTLSLGVSAGWRL